MESGSDPVIIWVSILTALVLTVVIIIVLISGTSKLTHPGIESDTGEQLYASLESCLHSAMAM